MLDKIHPHPLLSIYKVYLAEDTRLTRQVAIKVLPEDVRGDPARLARFRREAEAAAHLNHPNIAGIYAFEEAVPTDDASDDGEPVPFIVMEYVDGVTLSDVISGGARDVGGPTGNKGVLQYALTSFFDVFIPLADALAHAHEHGRIHRDLKPGNIMIASDGTPKILDFGLAKIFILHPSSFILPDADSKATTVTMPANFQNVPPPELLSKPGVLIGTPAYMSPEQAAMRETDHRSDLFSLGIILYEALTGQRPFKGQAPAEIISSILKDDPQPVTALKPEIPHRLSRITARCLQKDLQKRYHAAADLRNDLEEAKEEAAAPPPAQEAATPVWQRPMWIAATALLMALSATLAWLWGTGGDGGQKKRVIKTQIALSSDLDPVSGPTISPDGTMVAYVDRGRLWVRDLDKLESRGIEDTDGAVMPFWSPDNEYIGFQSQNTLWKIAPEGGKRIKIADLPPGLLYHAIWGSDDTIILNTGTSIPIELFSVSDQGGVPEPFRTPDTTRGERAISSSLFLPDGMSLLYSIFSSDGTIRTVLDSRGGETRTLTDSRTFRSSFSKIVLSPTGHMLSGNNVDGLWARPFSTKPLSYTGDPILVDQLGAYPSISRDGTIVYTRQASTGRQQLMWVNRDGRPGELIGQPQDMIDHPALSPDEKSVAVRGKENDNSDIWIHDTIRGTKRRITRAPVLDQQPAWLPDGDRISYTDGNGITFIARADASDTPQPLITDRPPRWSFHWSKDGSIVVYHIIAQRTGRDIWYQSMSDNEDPKSLIQTPSDEARPQLSPDGRHLAYQSDESGQWQVYICTFPDVTNKQQVSVNGGVWPQWNGNGDELFFVEENAMMAVKVNASGTPAIPERLFTGEEAGIALFSSTVNPTYPLGWRYDVTSDGQRFIVVKDLEPPKQSIVIVQNWFEEFRERE